MKKTILFLCVWFVLLGVVGAAKAILYTTADDGDHIFAPEFNNDKFWRDMEMDLSGHGSLRHDRTALWNEGRRYPRLIGIGGRGFSKGKHQFGNNADRPDYPSNDDAGEAGVPDLGTGLVPNWSEVVGPDVGDIAGYINETPPTGIILNPTPAAQATAPVPEPATLILVGAGLVGIAALKRKKLSQSK